MPKTMVSNKAVIYDPQHHDKKKDEKKTKNQKEHLAKVLQFKPRNNPGGRGT